MRGPVFCQPYTETLSNKPMEVSTLYFTVSQRPRLQVSLHQSQVSGLNHPKSKWVTLQGTLAASKWLGSGNYSKEEFISNKHTLTPSVFCFYQSVFLYCSSSLHYNLPITVFFNTVTQSTLLILTHDFGLNCLSLMMMMT